MRPESLDEFVGQEHLVGDGRILRDLIEGDRIPSLILWGPPGCGKTSLANVIAKTTGAHFITLSAVSSGVKDVKSVVEKARQHRSMFQASTILFVDEIHRFNKLQQDAFLPHVETGAITLIGATTENPSFEVIAPLLSRCRVIVLKPLDADAILTLLKRACTDEKRGLARFEIIVSDEDLRRVAMIADGDARFALGTLEIAVELYMTREAREQSSDERLNRIPMEDDEMGARPRVTIDVELIREALQEKSIRYDKAGDEHYDQISALHKAIRGSDPDAAIYWLARMIAGGEDPKYLARRMTRMAGEDIGLADPYALILASSVQSAVEFIGLPECDVHLAELAIYLACAPKSNRVYKAVGAVRKLIEETGSLPVPLHIRNAPTRLMKEQGYGEGYEYQHDFPDGFSKQRYLPETIDGSVFYRPTSRGFEEKLRERLMKLWRERY
jgi:putative ATPase